MDRLQARTAFDGLLPLRIGGVTVEETDLGQLTSVSLLGDVAALDQSLKDAHVLGWPAPNRTLGKDGNRCIWFGRNEVLLAGPKPDKALGRNAAVVDVSDGWGAVRISGAATVDVLARLVPVDLRSSAFKRGHTVRTQLGHMNVSLTRIGADAILILVFRSMAATLVHDLKQAMAGVAARG